MEMPINKDPALLMHVDLNSCFAIIEQQANPLIRNQPVAVAAYDTPAGIIIASSYEAKALGIKLGVSVREAREIYNGVHILTPDPEKYFDAHKRFSKILSKYSDKVWAKSVDEFLIDFKGSNYLRDGLSLRDIGHMIKRDVKYYLGEYVTINVGIGNNPFLAKLAAGLNKPDGMDLIDHNNILDVYKKISLVDLPGINFRYEARLNLAGIYSPLDFLNSPVFKLKDEVFKSINGYYWYLRLRGYLIDNIDYKRKSFGNQYALGHKTRDQKELSRLLMKLSEKTGRRLRAKRFYAKGIRLYLRFEDGSYFNRYKTLNYPIYASLDIYKSAYRILESINIISNVREMSVSVFKLSSKDPEQLDLFNGYPRSVDGLAEFSDTINDRYGEYTLIPALMANMEDLIIKRVAFGKNQD